MPISSLPHGLCFVSSHGWVPACLFQEFHTNMAKKIKGTIQDLCDSKPTPRPKPMFNPKPKPKPKPRPKPQPAHLGLSLLPSLPRP